MKPLTFPQLANLTETQAREYLEKLRWNGYKECPHCTSREVYKLTPKEDSKKPVRNGVYKCKKCRKQFTATVGTVMEGSHIPIKKWLMVMSLMCASKKGISSHQLHRMLGVTYKTAWFMSHRIRLAMEKDITIKKLSGIVEIDDGYVGGKEKGYKGKSEKANRE